jgi:hypothetical protein
MNEIEVIERIIFLQKQSIGLIIDEILQKQDKSSLFRLKGQLEEKIRLDGTDPVLSRKIDCITYLIEN